MPYLFLIAGILLALFAIYRFIVRSNVEQIRLFLLYSFFGIFSLILLFFAVTGRVVVSLLLVVLFIPFVIAHYRNKARLKAQEKAKEIAAITHKKDEEDPS